MRTNVAAGMLYLGTLLLAFGIVIAAIELLAVSFGSSHPLARILGIGLLIGGGVLVGGANMMRRSSRAGTSTN